METLYGKDNKQTTFTVNPQCVYNLNHLKYIQVPQDNAAGVFWYY